MPYTYSAPAAASFTDRGLSGYTFGPLKHEDVEIYYIESEKGHDAVIVSKKINRIYYILSGTGHFTIDNKEVPVEAGVVVEVPRQVEYTYTGKMTLLCISVPRWFPGNDIFRRWNPDVIGFDAPCAADSQTWLATLARFSIFGKSPVSVYLRLNQWLWTKVPETILRRRPIQSYGGLLHKLVCARQRREPFLPTYFLGNRSKLELIRRLADRKKIGDTLRVAIVGCNYRRRSLFDRMANIFYTARLATLTACRGRFESGCGESEARDLFAGHARSGGCSRIKLHEYD